MCNHPNKAQRFRTVLDFSFMSYRKQNNNTGRSREKNISNWRKNISQEEREQTRLLVAYRHFPQRFRRMRKIVSGNRRRQWHPTPVPLPGKSLGWRSLLGCSPWGRQESDTTERLHFHFSLSLFTFMLEKEMATHSSVLAWRIPGTGEPGGLPSMRSHRVGHD